MALSALMEVRATVTFLEMRAPFPRVARRAIPDQPNPKLHFEPHCHLPLADYRALYADVGDEWFWVNRKNMSDRDLSQIIHHPSTEIGVLYDGHRAIGFSEINRLHFPTIEIVFIGLVRDYIGQGLGRFLLTQSLRDAIHAGANHIKIQTSTLDHPHALGFYQKYGFEACNRQQVILRGNQFYQN